MINKLLIVSSVLLTFFIASLFTVSGQNNESDKIRVNATLIAYELILTNALRQDNTYNTQVLIIHVNKVLKGKTGAQYIKVVYKGYAENSQLPSQIFDGASQWQFKLKRDRNCDTSLGVAKYIKGKAVDGKEILIPRYIFTSKVEQPSDRLILPCYILLPKGIKSF